jgi:O-methyltransferase
MSLLHLPPAISTWLAHDPLATSRHLTVPVVALQLLATLRDVGSTTAIAPAADKGRTFRAQRLVRALYVRWIRPHVRSDISQQRLKLLWFVFGYRHLLGISELTALQKLRLISRFLKIDWNVLHSHEPAEIAAVCRALGLRRGKPGEVLLEAGCWNGGSSAKFSLICKELDYSLAVFDSFAGVEEMSEEEKSASFDFSGSYAASVESVRANIRQYGALEVCTFHPGWFADTLAKHPPPFPVRVAYIDCDVATGTHDALNGIVPMLTPDGAIFSQDFHLTPVKRMLRSAETWQPLHRRVPGMQQHTRKLVELRFQEPAR